MEDVPQYSLTLDIDYPDRKLNRLSTFFRLIWIIPIAIILGMVLGGGTGAEERWAFEWGYGGLVVVPTVLLILFRQKYPRWWFDWNLALTRFGVRVGAYFALLTDVYPSTDEEQSVHLDIIYPDAKTELNRWLPLIKWFLAIPHYIVLFFLWISAIVILVFAWFAIVFSGRYPRSFFDFVVGVARWNLRVVAYAFLLVTDKYPPFSLD